VRHLAEFVLSEDPYEFPSAAAKSECLDESLESVSRKRSSLRRQRHDFESASVRLVKQETDLLVGA
jgi:hypothetical protein